MPYTLPIDFSPKAPLSSESAGVVEVLAPRERLLAQACEDLSVPRQQAFLSVSSRTQSVGKGRGRSPRPPLSLFWGIIMISWNYRDIVELSCYRDFIVIVRNLCYSSAYYRYSTKCVKCSIVHPLPITEYFGSTQGSTRHVQTPGVRYKKKVVSDSYLP